MKKTITIVSVLVFLALSCTKAYPPMEQKMGDSGRQVLQCEMEASVANTKTALLSDAQTVVWQLGDKISVLSGSGSKDTLSIISGMGKTSAEFAGNLTAPAPYAVFYPASEMVSLTANVLSFHLPASQTFVENSFGEGASPMVAWVEDVSSPVQFRNLCGLLCLKLSAKPSFRVSKLVIKDLAGNQLWGDCCLTLDGTEGTDAQKMVITGGSDEITLLLSPVRYLVDSAPLKLYVAIPPGALNSGFMVSVYDENGERQAVFKTLNGDAVVERSMISNMAPLNIKTEPADPGKRGYYKDLFMDSGVKLVNRAYLPSADAINWDYEYQATVYKYTGASENDYLIQKTIFERADDDENGYLLYPDRQPRFRCIYVNGGQSNNHGESLGTTGRKTIYDFVYNGGSYVGTCAGAFIACKGVGSSTYENYLGIFPGYMYKTVIAHDRPDMIMPLDSPLRAYYDFGGTTISSVLHSGGGYMSEQAGRVPVGTEVLLRYGNWPAGTPSDEGKVGIWAYKPNEKVGRMVLCGSHPEYGTTVKKNNFNLFTSMLLYAADGHGAIPVKASLTNGVWYRCESMSSENNPAHARIGDKQYHHFTVDIPEGARNLVVMLESKWEEDDLYLSLNKGDFAWFSEADYVQDDEGSNKTLKIRKPEAGTYYVSVYAPNTVTSTLTHYDGSGLYFKYTGKTHLLNGIPYSIKVDWE